MGIGDAKSVSSSTSRMLCCSSIGFLGGAASNVLDWASGLEFEIKLLLRIRLRDWLLARRGKTIPALGAEKTEVPGLARGGGVGESERNNG